MSNGFPLDNYQVRQLKKYATASLIIFLSVLLFGNIITAIVKKSISIDRKDYVIKEGFPLFTSQDAYIDFIRKYPYNPGTKLTIHRIRKHESYWDICLRHHISLDTLVAANPFLNELVSAAGTEIVIPSEDGVLMAFDDIFDVWRMSKRLGFTGVIQGDYRPGIFRIISTDDMRLVFYKKCTPVIVNSSLERLYRFRHIFQSPVNGYYTSLFGERVNPFFHGMMEFHNGIDIQSRIRTPIHAAREGMVTFTGWRNGYGNTIVIQHDDGYTTLYGHCSKIIVSKGDWVTKKDTIGLIGSTGRSTGPHLHFTIERHGNIINPILFIW